MNFRELLYYRPGSYRQAALFGAVIGTFLGLGSLVLVAALVVLEHFFGTAVFSFAGCP